MSILKKALLTTYEKNLIPRKECICNIGIRIANFNADPNTFDMHNNTNINKVHKFYKKKKKMKLYWKKYQNTIGNTDIYRENKF